MLDPSYVQAQHSIGLVYEELGDYVRALEAYEKAIAIGSRYAISYLGRRLASYHLGNYRRALADDLIKDIEAELAALPTATPRR